MAKTGIKGCISTHDYARFKISCVIFSEACVSNFGFDVRDILCGTIYIVADYYDEEAEDTYLVDLPEDRVKFYLEAYKEPEQIDEEEVFHSICMEFFGM